jgi:hypothetical protein
MYRILLIDLSYRELQARNKLTVVRDQLRVVESSKDTSGGLTTAQEAQLALYNSQLNSDNPVDDFYQAVAATILRKQWPVPDQGPLQGSGQPFKHGLFVSQQVPPGQQQGADLSADEQEIAFTCGLLELDNLVVPTMANFVAKVTQAQGEYRQNIDLFNRAYRRFRHKFTVSVQSQIDGGQVDGDVIGCINPGDPINQPPPDPAANNQAAKAAGANAANNPPPGRRLDTGKLPNPIPKDWSPRPEDVVAVLSAKNIAAVVRNLASNNIGAGDAWIDNRLDSAYDRQAGVIDGGPPSSLEISLPDLDDDTDVEIIAENLNAVQAIYFSWQLEEMRMFQVVEKIVDLFRQGLLPLGRGSVGDYLFNYYKTAAERLSENERRDLYMRLFGAPGGNPSAEPNRDFNELWMRFVSAVSNFSRQLTVERMLRGKVPLAVTQEQVRKAARDLGTNLSRNGYGIAYFAAVDLQGTILKFRDVLQNQDLRTSFGARDMWQVIDQVNVNYLGGARNTFRYRTQAKSGAVVIRWIAKNVARLSSIGGQVIEIEQIVNPLLRATSSSNNPTVDPTDYDLVNACEQWLAVGGVQDQSIEQYSQPIEAPTMTSRPIDIPPIARDMLGGMGIGINGSGMPSAPGVSLPGM